MSASAREHTPPDHTNTAMHAQSKQKTERSAPSWCKASSSGHLFVKIFNRMQLSRCALDSEHSLQPP
eukprot:6194960-Pleurochrysis_carterae.AAC.2